MQTFERRLGEDFCQQSSVRTNLSKPRNIGNMLEHPKLGITYWSLIVFPMV